MNLEAKPRVDNGNEGLLTTSQVKSASTSPFDLRALALKGLEEESDSELEDFSAFKNETKKKKKAEKSNFELQKDLLKEIEAELEKTPSPPPKGQRLAPVGQEHDEEKDDGINKAKMIQKVNGARGQDLGGSGNLLAIPGGAAVASQNTELVERIQELEDEQEELNNSLMSMTSHFAKVQLRLQQVVNAPTENKESLLKELEQFAFRGIPNVSSPRPLIDTTKNAYQSSEAKVCRYTDEEDEDLSDVEAARSEIIESQRRKHAELINQLKSQLEELESYAYESGEGVVPDKVILERQAVVMEQLKEKLNLRMDNIEELTEEELKAEVDSAVGQIVNPLKMKSHLVNQLKTQITDLEMFIGFLQKETQSTPAIGCDDCGCNQSSTSAKSSPQKANNKSHSRNHNHHHHRNIPKYRTRTELEQEEIRQRTVSILQKAMAVLQLAAVSQFGCGSEHFSKNSLKDTPKGNHYGDLRARLELAVDHMLDACSQVDCLNVEDSTSQQDNQPEFLMASGKVTQIARREIASAIRDLMQHGLNEPRRTRSRIPFMGCMSGRNAQLKTTEIDSAKGPQGPHAWDVVLRFYNLKGGHEYNSAPQRKLSQSFGLDLSQSAVPTPKSNGSNNRTALLTTIGQIIASHGPYKRSKDAHFKAFVCAGLNKRKLIPWLKLVLRNQEIIESFYQPWSYVVRTGFDDSFRALDRLSIYVFDIPVNVAVKQFQEMNEAF